MKINRKCLKNAIPSFGGESSKSVANDSMLIFTTKAGVLIRKKIGLLLSDKRIFCCYFANIFPL